LLLLFPLNSLLLLYFAVNNTCSNYLILFFAFFFSSADALEVATPHTIDTASERLRALTLCAAVASRAASALIAGTRSPRPEGISAGLLCFVDMLDDGHAGVRSAGSGAIAETFTAAVGVGSLRASSFPFFFINNSSIPFFIISKLQAPPTHRN
jgi:hypothetical protein